MRLTVAVIIGLAALGGAEKPPSKPLKPPGLAGAAARGSRPAVATADAGDDTLPGDAPERKPSMLGALGGVMGTPEQRASGGEIARSIRPQLASLFIVLLLRFGLSILKTRKAAGVMGEGVGEALLASPLAPLVRAFAKLQAFARSPQSAPFMIGLLIISTKLVARMEGGGAVEVVEVVEEADAGVDKAVEEIEGGGDDDDTAGGGGDDDDEHDGEADDDDDDDDGDAATFTRYEA